MKSSSLPGFLKASHKRAAVKHNLPQRTLSINPGETVVILEEDDEDDEVLSFDALRSSKQDERPQRSHSGLDRTVEQVMSDVSGEESRSPL